MARVRKDWLEWFRVDRDLPTHPRLLELARLRGWNRLEALGHLIVFWSWVARHVPRGIASDAELLTAQELGSEIEALKASKFIEPAPGGGWRIRNWWNFNGKQLKDRAGKRNGNSAEIPREIPNRSEPTGRDGTVLESKEKHSRRRSAPESEPEGFPEFYQAYPRRDGRRAAAKAFASALKRHPTYTSQNLAEGAVIFAGQCRDRGVETRFIPLPATWLNQDRFRELFDEDDSPEAADAAPEDLELNPS